MLSKNYRILQKYMKSYFVSFSRGIKVVVKVCPRLCLPLISPTLSDQSVSPAQGRRWEWYEIESCYDMHGKRPAAMFLTWQLKQANEKQMGDCETEQFDLFITIILNTSFYLGVIILIVMITIGLYFFIFHCFWKPYSKRY